MPLYIALVIACGSAVVAFFGSGAWIKYREKRRNEHDARYNALIAEIEGYRADMKTINTNYAIIEQTITPFMEWVEQVKAQQKFVVTDAAERAEAFQKARTITRREQ